jgi:3-hydroxyacyl-[acyl-carrier-protein] dehydratase
MILLNNFYTIQNANSDSDTAAFRVKLNAENFVYKAHFPNSPITPGVCIIKMATELFETLKSENFSIKTLQNVKFTAPISPLEFPEVDFLLNFAENQNQWQVKVIIKENQTVFAKLNLLLQSTNKK